jgi:hypothetical protein
MERARRAGHALQEAYVRGPALYRPDELLRDLREIDPHLLSNLVRELGYMQLGVSEASESDRRRAVTESRYLVLTSPLVEYALWLWTAFGFGQSVDVVCKDDAAVEVWNEFWHADRNANVLGDRQLQRLSGNVLEDGERFLAVYVSKADGKCTLRSIDSLEITEAVTAPGDASTAVWYKREWTEVDAAHPNGAQYVAYYPDFLAFLSGGMGKAGGAEELAPGKGGRGEDPEWYGISGTGPITSVDLLPQGAVRADQMAPRTFVCVIPVCHNVKTGWRGWPLMVTGHPWAREHERFRMNRANVAESRSMFVNLMKSKAGSRGVDAVKATMDSTLTQAGNTWERNPPPVAGSTLHTNDMTELRQLDMATGASDAKEDGNSLLWYAGLSARTYPHWLGQGDFYKLATSTQMEMPQLRTFTGYQTFWASVWRDLARVVLNMAERYGGQTFADREVEVNLDRLLERDTTSLVANISATFTQVVTPLLQAELLPDESIPGIVAGMLQAVLQAIGIKDVEKIVSEDMIAAQLEAAKEKQAQDAELARQIAAGKSNEAAPGEGQPEEAPAEEEAPEEAATEAQVLPVEMAAMFAAAQRVLMRG